MGEAEIVFLFVCPDGAAVGAGVDLVVEAKPSASDGTLEVPMAGEGEVVAVAEAESCAPPLLALVGAVEEGKVGDVVVDVGDVDADEVLVESFAEPIAQLGVHAEVAEAAAVRSVVALVLEGVEADFALEGEVAGEAELCAEVRCGGGPVEEVGFGGQQGASGLLQGGAGGELA